jgi:aarF domain-containing kinase
MLDVATMSQVCKEWGIHDSNMFASITLQRPFSPDKAVHLQQNIQVKDMYKLQSEMKERIKHFLKDQALFPRELIFISRNMNIVRANNKSVGSPINRINLMARWAVEGLQKGTWLSWRSMLFETTLLLMSMSFWLIRFRDAASRLLFHSQTRGLEDVLDDNMKDQMYKRFGIKIDETLLEG